MSPRADVVSRDVEPTRTVSVPLFNALIDSLAEDKRWVILDLGKARPQTIDLLSNFRCRVDVADLEEVVVASLDWKNETVPAPDPVESLEAMPQTEQVDVTLTWDYLNYLSQPQITGLMTAIAKRSRPGALAHALIGYSGSVMARRPGLLAPLDEGRLIDLSTGTPDRPATRYSTEDLDRCSPGFMIERIRLLTSGMQEYLFRLQPAGNASH